MHPVYSGPSRTPWSSAILGPPQVLRVFALHVVRVLYSSPIPGCGPVVHQIRLQFSCSSVALASFNASFFAFRDRCYDDSLNVPTPLASSRFPPLSLLLVSRPCRVEKVGESWRAIISHY